jgi:hypothetical protein
VVLRVDVAGGSTLIVGRVEGWCEWRLHGYPDVRVRLARDSFRGVERLGVIAVAVGSLERGGAAVRVTGDHLRRLPMGSLERRVNEPEVERVVLAALRDQDGPDLRPHRARWVEAADADVDVLRLFDVESKWDSLRLDVPRGRKIDGFYAAVLDAYERASGWSRSPAVEVARANDKPVPTVHRWVREAKLRAGRPQLFADGD